MPVPRFAVSSFACACLVFYWALFSLYEFTLRLMGSAQLAYIKDGRLYTTDFVCLYQAGKMAMSSCRYAIYDAACQLDWLNRVISPLKSDVVIAIPYPPYVYWLMQPLAMLPLHWSYVLFSVLVTAFGVLSLVLLMTSQKRFSALECTLLVMAVLASLPSQITLTLGQLAYFFVGVVSLYLLALERNWHVLAGVCLAVSTIKPHYAIFLSLPVLIQGRWRTLLVAMVVATAIFALAGLSMGWQNYLDYPGYVSGAYTSGLLAWMNPAYEVNIKALFAPFLQPASSFWLGFLIALLFIALLGVLWKKATDRRSLELSNWAAALTVLGMLAGSPHTCNYDCLFLSVCAVKTLPFISVARAWSLNPIDLRVWVCGLLLYPVINFVLAILVPLVSAGRAEPLLVMNLTLLAVNLVLLIAGSVYVARLIGGARAATGNQGAPP
ncbi:MAG TPA: glycosyltransferase family 87 protein [Candidatus Obscuribacterales bacterium]